MKKRLCLLAVMIVTAFFMIDNKTNNNNNNKETRGVFISYLEYEEYFTNKSNKEIENKIEEIVLSLDKYNINTIYLQVRMFSDSIYKSKIFPKTNIIENDIDLLSLFLKYAKKNNIKVYAWINPYRIAHNTDITKISKDNPAYKYLNTNNIEVIENKGIYYNPASKIVKDLIIAGVMEIVEGYEIDGIIYDDYFYPSKTIDLENYKEYASFMSIEEYRLGIINDLISSTYKAIKSIDQNIEFGVSPDGNIENDYDYLYADVKKWLSEEGYIDFIMPQLYYGFYNEVKPFIKTVNEWNDLIKNDTKLIVALALYKSGKVDLYAKTGKNEWLDYTNIISREIDYSKELSYYNGYSLFRFGNLLEKDNPYLTKEIKNYLK